MVKCSQKSEFSVWLSLSDSLPAALAPGSFSGNSRQKPQTDFDVFLGVKEKHTKKKHKRKKILWVPLPLYF